MSITEFSNPSLSPLINAEKLQTRIREIGEAITRDYDGKNPHLICVLKGAAMFLGDLMKTIDLPLTVDFIAVSSYGKEKKSSGEVQVVKDLGESLEGRHVLIVEDILDTGLTLNYLINNFKSRGPASIKIVALLNKPSRREIPVEASYVGFDIPDAFVVGYGLDYAERFRNLPFIAIFHGN
ncbi:MAG TPA: hypoxanthine phosphoribosyltransferase [Blastocatellia bacterium]|nr:hypoxanthine phosphoribosyltransferase [Blastocatellia bacterium]